MLKVSNLSESSTSADLQQKLDDLTLCQTNRFYDYRPFTQNNFEFTIKLCNKIFYCASMMLLSKL